MIVEELPWCEPAEAGGRLRSLGGLMFLDSAMRHPRLGRYSYVAAAPSGVLTAWDGRSFWNGHPVEGRPLEVLENMLRVRARPRDPALPPFQGGAVGLLSYGLGRDLQKLARPRPASPVRIPDVHLAFYDTVLAFDHELGKACLIASPPERNVLDGSPGAVAEPLAAFRNRLAAPREQPAGYTPIAREAWRSNFDAARYREAVAAVVEAILDGEIFQANIAQRFAASTPAGYDPWSFYGRLRSVNPAPFGAFLDLGTWTVASSSPELFTTVDGDRVETRPIKGTTARSDDPEEDRRLAARLAASEKDRAENVMIVDLLRNDLSRVCRPHDVAVPMLCGLESYAGVHHLVSSVTGRLKPGTSAIDLIAAAFPGGSITGAPKHQAMQVIDRIEREPRGAYCGSIGWFGYDGAMATNIAIRTVTFADGCASFHVGGGVTALSDPEAEYRETLVKAERIFQAFEAA